MEVTVMSIHNRRLTDRGFLIGPYCPIYGTGALIIIILLEKYMKDPFTLFVMAIFWCSVVEYITSFLMEKLFNTRWWDYSDHSFNINGRICLTNSILFGLLGMIILYFVNPFLTDIILLIPTKIGNIIAIILLLVFVVDLILSWCIIHGLKTTSLKIDKDYTEEITKKVREILQQKSVLSKRLVNAFPNFQALMKQQEERSKKLMNDTKNKIEKLANSITTNKNKDK